MVHCGYAFMLSFSSIYMAIHTPGVEQSFLKQLNNNQKLEYQSIRKERLQIYMKSLFMGFVIASIYYQKVKNDICYFLGIMLTCTSLFYMAIPKTKYMINSIQTPSQFKALSDLQRQQKYNGVTSSLFALLIWGLISQR